MSTPPSASSTCAALATKKTSAPEMASRSGAPRLRSRSIAGRPPAGACRICRRSMYFGQLPKLCRTSRTRPSGPEALRTPFARLRRRVAKSMPRMPAGLPAASGRCAGSSGSSAAEIRSVYGSGAETNPGSPSSSVAEGQPRSSEAMATNGSIGKNARCCSVRKSRMPPPCAPPPARAWASRSPAWKGQALATIPVGRAMNPEMYRRRPRCASSSSTGRFERVTTAESQIVSGGQGALAGGRDHSLRPVPRPGGADHLYERRRPVAEIADRSRAIESIISGEEPHAIRVDERLRRSEPPARHREPGADAAERVAPAGQARPQACYRGDGVDQLAVAGIGAAEAVASADRAALEGRGVGAPPLPGRAERRGTWCDEGHVVVADGEDHPAPLQGVVPGTDHLRQVEHDRGETFPGGLEDDPLGRRLGAGGGAPRSKALERAVLVRGTSPVPRPDRRRGARIDEASGLAAERRAHHGPRSFDVGGDEPRQIPLVATGRASAVHHSLDSPECPVEASLVVQFGAQDPRSEPSEVPHVRGRTHDRAYGVARVEQALDHVQPDEPVRSGNRDEHAHLLRARLPALVFQWSRCAAQSTSRNVVGRCRARASRQRARKPGPHKWTMVKACRKTSREVITPCITTSIPELFPRCTEGGARGDL